MQVHSYTVYGFWMSCHNAYIPLEYKFSLISFVTHFLNEKFSMLEGDKFHDMNELTGTVS